MFAGSQQTQRCAELERLSLHDTPAVCGATEEKASRRLLLTSGGNAWLCRCIGLHARLHARVGWLRALAPVVPLHSSFPTSFTTSIFLGFCTLTCFRRCIRTLNCSAGHGESTKNHQRKCHKNKKSQLCFSHSILQKLTSIDLPPSYSRPAFKTIVLQSSVQPPPWHAIGGAPDDANTHSANHMGSTTQGVESTRPWS